MSILSVLSKVRALLTVGRGVVRGIDADRLTRGDAGPDPFALFGRWFADATHAGLYLPETMTVSTVGRDGRPSSRQVLLKTWDPDGFVFYTNYDSRKADEIEANPRVALLLHWVTLHRQVRIEGRAERTPEAESEAYFRTRPRGSQIAAWASSQSAELADRDELERRFRAREEEFEDRDVPLPPFWGGYRVVPSVIEFWQGRANRMHDRLVYRKRPGGWEVVRLSP